MRLHASCLLLVTLLVMACAAQRPGSSGRVVHPTDLHPGGYLALPAGGKGPGVLVLHAWWGLNDTVEGFCNRLAEAGFVAFAPDLYHGKIARTIDDAQALAHALDEHSKQAKVEVRAAAGFLASQSAQPDRIAVMGFSLGAFYALDLAATEPDDIYSVVVFYGTGGPTRFDRSRAAFMGHYAENDPYEPRANVDALERALKRADRPVVFYHYPNTGHWFVEPDVSEAYDAPAADFAWRRTLRFLKERAGLE